MTTWPLKFDDPALHIIISISTASYIYQFKFIHCMNEVPWFEAGVVPIRIVLVALIHDSCPLRCLKLAHFAEG